MSVTNSALSTVSLHHPAKTKPKASLAQLHTLPTSLMAQSHLRWLVRMASQTIYCWKITERIDRNLEGCHVLSMNVHHQLDELETPYFLEQFIYNRLFTARVMIGLSNRHLKTSISVE